MQNRAEDSYKICAARLLAEAASAHAELAKARAEYDTKLKTKTEAHHAALAAVQNDFADHRANLTMAGGGVWPVLTVSKCLRAGPLFAVGNP